MQVPDRYSAELETSTVNGRVRIDFPVMLTGLNGRSFRTTLGSGGARLRAVTTTGGVADGEAEASRRTSSRFSVHGSRFVFKFGSQCSVPGFGVPGSGFGIPGSGSGSGSWLQCSVHACQTTSQYPNLEPEPRREPEPEPEPNVNTN